MANNVGTCVSPDTSISTLYHVIIGTMVGDFTLELQWSDVKQKFNILTLGLDFFNLFFNRCGFVIVII